MTASPSRSPSVVGRGWWRRYVSIVDYRGPGSTVMLLYAPGVLALLALELWLGLPWFIAVASAIGLAVALIFVARALDRIQS